MAAGPENQVMACAGGHTLLFATRQLTRVSPLPRPVTVGILRDSFQDPGTEHPRRKGDPGVPHPEAMIACQGLAVLVHCDWHVSTNGEAGGVTLVGCRVCPNSCVLLAAELRLACLSGKLRGLAHPLRLLVTLCRGHPSAMHLTAPGPDGSM